MIRYLVTVVNQLLSIYESCIACCLSFIGLPGFFLKRIPAGKSLRVRKLLVMADQGRSGALEEIVIRLQCKISKTGKALETSKSSDQ